MRKFCRFLLVMLMIGAAYSQDFNIPFTDLLTSGRWENTRSDFILFKNAFEGRYDSIVKDNYNDFEYSATKSILSLRILHTNRKDVLKLQRRPNNLVFDTVTGNYNYIWFLEDQTTHKQYWLTRFMTNYKDQKYINTSNEEIFNGYKVQVLDYLNRTFSTNTKIFLRLNPDKKSPYLTMYNYKDKKYKNFLVEISKENVVHRLVAQTIEEFNIDGSFGKWYYVEILLPRDCFGESAGEESLVKTSTGIEYYNLKSIYCWVFGPLLNAKS